MESKFRRILIIFFTLLICTSSHSQQLCEYGGYDFILNKIKGVDKINFSKIDFIIKNDSIKYTYKYDNGKLINANFYGNATYFNETREMPCEDVDLVFYEYEEKVINIRSDSLSQKARISYNDNSDVEGIFLKNFKIDYIYDSDKKLEKIKNDNIKYEYFWNKNSLIDKIIITFLNDNTKQEIKFYYSEEKLSSTTYLRTRQGYNLRNKKYNYIYEDNQLCQVKCEINNKNIIYYDYSYDDDEKLVITTKNKNKEYLSNYECYY